MPRKMKSHLAIKERDIFSGSCFCGDYNFLNKNKYKLAAELYDRYTCMLLNTKYFWHFLTHVEARHFPRK